MGDLTEALPSSGANVRMGVSETFTACQRTVHKLANTDTVFLFSSMPRFLTDYRHILSFAALVE